MRSVQWRADAPATLAWVEALDQGNARLDAEHRDRVFTLPAPFQAEPTPLIDLPLRYAGIQWGTDDVALVYESWFATRMARTYVVEPARPGSGRLLFEYSYEEPYADPGRPVTHAAGNGTSVLTLADGGRAIYLVGDGASPEGERPFLRQMDLRSGATEELFRSEAPYYEEPVEVLDAEGPLHPHRSGVATDPPNYFVRDLDADRVVARSPASRTRTRSCAGSRRSSSSLSATTAFRSTATLYLPAGYDAESDGPLPDPRVGLPREYKSAAAAAAGERLALPVQPGQLLGCDPVRPAGIRRARRRVHPHRW